MNKVLLISSLSMVIGGLWFFINGILGLIKNQFVEFFLY